MIETPEKLPAREARYPLLEGRVIKATVERQGGLPPEEIDAELVDVSMGGVKLLVSKCPAMQEAVVLKMVAPEIELDLSVNAEVCWTRPAPGDAWYLGCTLNPKLPEQLLTDLAVKGYVQRRRDPRIPIDLPASMRSEGSLESVPVRLLDYSTGGLRLAAPHTAATGQRLLFRFGEGPNVSDLIVAKTMWQAQTSDGHQIGCTFVNRDGHRIFQDVVRAINEPTVAKPVELLTRSRWPLLALAALVGILIFRYFFLP
jgi:hypothetical protein